MIYEIIAFFGFRFVQIVQKRMTFREISAKIGERMSPVSPFFSAGAKKFAKREENGEKSGVRSQFGYNFDL